MASAIKKVNMIARIVRLRQVVRSWKAKSLTRLASRYISPDFDDPDASKRRTSSGSVAVYVGQDRRRFVIPTRFLNMPVFGDLLHEAEKEFGFQTTGGLLLPCEPSFFEEILRYLEEDEEKFCGFELNEFLRMCNDPLQAQWTVLHCPDLPSDLAHGPGRPYPTLWCHIDIAVIFRKNK